MAKISYYAGIGALILVFVLGLAIRLYDLTDPPLDFNAVVQLRSAMIARGVYYRLDTAADPAIRQQAIAIGSLEPYEPSILENIVGFTYWVVGSEDLWISRIYTSLFWLIGGAALFALARRVASFPAALLGLAFYVFLPFGVVASRSFQPDPWMVMWILISAYAFFRWSESIDGPPRLTWRWCLIAGIIGGVTILVKVMAGFFIMGMLAGVVLGKIKLRRLFKSPSPWIVALLSLLPSLIYYIFTHGANSATYFTFWTVSFAHMLLTSKFYSSWMGMVNSLMTLPVVMVAIFGVFLARKEIKPLLIGLWVGYALFGLAWPFQYTTHDYYHLTLVGIVGLSLTPVLDVVLRALNDQHLFWRLAAVGVFIFASGYSLWVSRSVLYVADYRSEPQAWYKIGQAIPANSSFVALTGDFGYRLMYYGWRMPTAMWPGLDTLEMQAVHGNSPLDYQNYFDSITSGKEYFLVTGALTQQPQLKTILDQYGIAAQSADFTLYDLTQPKH